jgi:hypothetical protein
MNDDKSLYILSHHHDDEHVILQSIICSLRLQLQQKFRKFRKFSGQVLLLYKYRHIYSLNIEIQE